ncbi:hypothetical protein [Haladaptatus halobius]|uniref:hypothetical protein n=1 Tax=Haladaptatus halobius TaxID=2884875 RepID=UPI001D0B6419|nr:hypothetical protein [Haladaptatus halobius]
MTETREDEIDAERLATRMLENDGTNGLEDSLETSVHTDTDARKYEAPANECPIKDGCLVAWRDCIERQDRQWE